MNSHYLIKHILIVNYDKLPRLGIDRRWRMHGHVQQRIGVFFGNSVVFLIFAD